LLADILADLAKNGPFWAIFGQKASPKAPFWRAKKRQKPKKRAKDGLCLHA